MRWTKPTDPRLESRNLFIASLHDLVHLALEHIMQIMWPLKNIARSPSVMNKRGGAGARFGDFNLASA